MQDMSSAVPASIDDKGAEPNAMAADAAAQKDAVSTHVLVAEEQVAKLRELSRRTRIAQSEYLREAVEDLLVKYGRSEKEIP
jgi:hypothetical protein